MSDRMSRLSLDFYEKAANLDARTIMDMIAEEKTRLLDQAHSRIEVWRTAGDTSAPLDLSELGTTTPLALEQALEALAGADGPVATAGARRLDLSNNDLRAIDLTRILAGTRPTDLRLSRCRLTALPDGLPRTIQTLDVSGNALTGLPSHLPSLGERLDISDNHLRRIDPSLVGVWLSECRVNIDGNPLAEGDRAVLTAMSNTANQPWTGTFPDGSKAPGNRKGAWLGYPDWSAWANDGPATEARQEAVRRIVGWVTAGDVDATLDLSGLWLTSLPPNLPATVFKLDAKGNVLKRLDPSLVARAIARCKIDVEGNPLHGGDLSALAAMAKTADQPWTCADEARAKQLPRSRPDTWQAYPAWSAWADAAEGPELRRDAVGRLVRWVATGDVDAPLDLSGLGLTSLPPDVPDTAIRLNVARNGLGTLDRILPTGLRELIADDNRLAAFPVGHRLKAFSVARNGLTSTPPGLSTTIEKLNLSGNAIDRVDDALLQFWLSGCDVDIGGNPLPESDMAALDLMSKTGSDHWRGVPKNDTKRRTILHPMGKPASMGGEKAEAWQGYAAWSEWARTKTSDGERRGEAMRRIMDWTADGNLSQPLDLSGLGLTSLPPHLPSRALTVKLDRNRLSASVEQVGEVLQQLKLTTDISITHNGLTSLPRLGPNVKTLHADDNAIETLGGALPSDLVTITLRNNRLTSLGEALPFSVRTIDARGNPIDTIDSGVMSLQISGCRLDIDDRRLSEETRSLVEALGKASSSKLPAYRDQKDVVIGGDQDLSKLLDILEDAKRSLAAIDFSRTTRLDGPVRKQGAKVAAAVGRDIDDTARQRLNEKIRGIEIAELDRIMKTRIGSFLDELEPKLALLKEAFDQAASAVEQLEEDVEADDRPLDIADRYRSAEKLCHSARSDWEKAQKAGQLIDPAVVRESLPEYDTGRWAAARELWRTCATSPLSMRLAEIKAQLSPTAAESEASTPS